ncbi:MAG TPA: galactose oxidase early set domain-containing protein, partial [Solirubrobacteraceae bacterium]|nr:galactose oxidase early set domain-containing protein [Solirubrobacteraceae bacterium]
FETRISVYEPGYLFKGARPVINNVDGRVNQLEGNLNSTAQWEYGESKAVSYSASKPITSAVLIRPAAVTHSSDPNQREVALPIEANAGGQLTVNLTKNANIAPPGYYMLYITDSSGVPSVAQWVHVGPQGS